MKKITKGICAVAAFVSVLAVMGSSVVGSAEKDAITILQSGEVTSLDPIKSYSTLTMNLNAQLFDPILDWDEKCENVVPSVALSMVVTKDPKVWELKIRPGITAHNGEVVDADDVAWTINNIVDPKSQATGMSWTQGNCMIEKAEAVDKLTVLIYTRKPNPTLIRFMPRWWVQPKDYYTSITPEEAARKPVGTGPYKLVQYRKGDAIVMEAFKNHWAGEPEIKRLIWRAVPEESARVAELNTGGADVIINVSPEQEKRIDPKVARMHKIQGTRIIFIRFNFNEHKELELIKDVRVRQALCYAVDIQKILDSLLGPGVAKRTGTTVNPPFNDPRIKPYPYDPKKALALMKEAGYYDRNGDGFVDKPNGERFELTVQFNAGRYMKDTEMIQAITANWRQNGIYIEAVPVDLSLLTDRSRQRKSTSALTLWGSGFSNTAQGDLSSLPSFNINYGSWFNKDFDKLWSELVETFDPKKQQELIYQCDKLVHDELPFVHLYYQVDHYGISNRLDWKPSPIEWMWFRTAKWAKK